MPKQRQRHVEILYKTTYTPEEAAKFLDISMTQLKQLVQRKHLTMHSSGRKRFFLAGEVEAVRSNVDFFKEFHNSYKWK